MPLDGRFFKSLRGAGEGLGEFIREVYTSLASQPISCEGVLVPAGEVPRLMLATNEKCNYTDLMNLPMPTSEFPCTSLFSSALLMAVSGLGARPPYAL